MTCNDADLKLTHEAFCNQVKPVVWSKNIVTWWDSEVLNISVVFSWQLASAVRYADLKRSEGYTVRIGGPAAKYAGIQNGETPALFRHNPQATFTSRGCIRKCEFCAVPKIEGDLRELSDWEPKPIVCDNNLLACSVRHFDAVIDRLKPIKGVDFNQGLDARLLTDRHIDRLKDLKLPILRFAWDFTPMESVVMNVIDRVLKAGFPKSRIHCYALIGFNDTPADALYRLQTLKDRGITPNCQRYQPLDTLVKDSFVPAAWSERELHRMHRYWSLQNWVSKVPYAEFVG